MITSSVTFGGGAAGPERVHLSLMLALTFSTGIVDAVGYLGLDRVFTANMTGNVVILGMGLMGAERLPVIGPVIALVAFMLGAVISGRTLGGQLDRWSHRSTVLFTVVGFVTAMLGLWTLAAPQEPGEPVMLTVTGLLGTVMGIQAGTARFLGVKDVTTVVVTSTLTALASESRLAGGRGQPWQRRALAVLLILAGATVGAGLLTIHAGVGLLAAALICLVCSWLGHAFGREPVPKP